MAVSRGLGVRVFSEGCHSREFVVYCYSISNPKTYTPAYCCFSIVEFLSIPSQRLLQSLSSGKEIIEDRKVLNSFSWAREAGANKTMCNFHETTLHHVKMLSQIYGIKTHLNHQPFA